MSRPLMITLPLFVLLALVLGGCGGPKEKPGNTIALAVIPKGTTHEFWKAIHAGAKQASADLRAQGTEVDIIWKGPLKEDDREQQIQTVESFIGRGVKGIVLAPLDSKALVAPVEQANAAGIPVVIIDSGLESQIPVSTVSTDNYDGGRKAGERLGSLLGGKGKVLMLRYAAGSASTELREKGFLDAMKEKYPDIIVVSSDQHSGPTRETAYQAAQNLLNRFGKDIQGVFTPNESSTAGMIMAMRDAGLNQGKVKHVGFDSGQLLVEALKAGDVQGLVLQDPYGMGYQGVMTLVAHIKGQPVEKSKATAVQLVTPENMATPEMARMLTPPKAD